MKKGTLNKLFGKKNANNNSLYAENPPWMLPQGNMKSSADYHDMPSSYSFLDDSGSATLKARPGPRIRPLLPVSTNSMAVPTPSVPEVFVEHHPIENGLNLNGHYRMYSSIGDLRGNMHDDDYPEEIPAPPSMPPPPPPNMPPPDPPHESPLSPSESSPGSPSPPDLIPPTPNSTALSVPNFVPPPPPSLSNQQLQSASKWKSETVLNNLPNDLPVGLPNRISLNPSIFQPSHGQTNSNMDPNSSLPRLFKVPPPAPTRTSSIQLQEYIDQQTDNTRYTKDPPPSPMQSSFNPTMQAKLFSTGRGQSSLNDILNKRKSMIIIDTPNEAKSMETSHTIEIASAINKNTESYGLTGLKAKMDVSLPGKTESGNNKVNSNSANQENTALNTSKEHCFRENPEKQTSKVRQIKNDFASTMSGKNSVKEGPKAFEDRTALKKDSYVSEMSKSSKPTVNIISLKPILGENQKLSNTNPHSKKDEDIQKPLDAMAGESNTEPVKVIKTPLSPPPVAPPPPILVPSNPPSVPPAPPLPAALTTAPIALPTSSPLLLSKKASATNLHPPPPPPPPPPAPQPTGSQSSPKAATLSASPVLPSMVPPQPPKAPPAPPPLPPFATSSVQISPSTPPKVLHRKDDNFKEIHSKHISAETRNTQPSFINTDNDQKINVGKIKQELEALLSSPKKEDLKVGSLKQFQHGPESPKKTPNDKVASLRGGENTLVNSLMMKVPLLPKQPAVEDTDTDTSEWLPKNNMADIKIPEPDYLPASSQQINNYKQPASYTMTKKIVESAPHPMTEEITVESVPHSITKEIIVELTPHPITKEIIESAPHPMIKEITVESAPLPKLSDELNTGETLIPSYKPHHARRVSAGSWTTVPVSSVPSKSEPVLSLKADTDQEPKEASPPLASLVKSTLSLRENESAFNHPVTGEKVDEGSPMALLIAAKKRAQKGSRSVERSNLPKVSVSNGVVLSSLTSHNSDINNPKTFVVVPRDETTQQALLKGSSSYLNDSGTVSFLGSSTDKYENNLEWIDQGQPKPTVSIQMFDSQHPSGDNTRRWSILNSSSTNKIQDSLSPQIKVIHPIAKNNICTKVEKFNLSSFPSSSPVLGTNDEMGYKIIPPPAQFMNNPTVPNMSIHNTEQKERSFIYGNNIISDYSKPSYEQNYTSNQTINNRDRYLDDHSITGLSRDSHKGSLIKKRLYMPEPETSINYGKTSTLRSAALPTPYSHRLPQTSPTMVLDPRRTNSTTRYLAQGRRVSTENLIRAVPSQSDMKYNAQNSEYPASRPSRPQTSYQGLTFNVRPGTRQPISNTYQGGYL